MAKSNKLPGYTGWPIIGDKTIDFLKNPVKFYEKHSELYKSSTFLTRLFNKPTVIVGTHEGVKQILCDQAEQLTHGYKLFMSDLYGDNLFVANEDKCEDIHRFLAEHFSRENLQNYDSIIERIINEELRSLDKTSPVDIYTFFKELSRTICFSLFLGIEKSQSEEEGVAAVADLTTTQWHGITSFPINIPLRKHSSIKFRKASDAKTELLGIIRKQRNEAHFGFVKQANPLPGVDDDVSINSNVLVFISSVVSKAIASYLTSFFVTTGQQNYVELQEKMFLDKHLENQVLLEIQRLYPPFVCGRKFAKTDCTIDGHKIPEGHAVIFLTYAAHRDETVFENPNELNAERWNEFTKTKLFTFGDGPRSCVGYHIVMSIVKSIVERIIAQYEWKTQTNETIQYKWLPVARPSTHVSVDFSSKVEIRHLGDQHFTRF
ncbi:cytochrome P450 26A1-like [Argonauta hians]